MRGGEKVEKEKILERAKEDMLELVEELSFENLDNNASVINQYIAFLKNLKALPSKTQKKNNDNIIEIREDNLREIYDEKSNIYLGEFKRELAGGTVGSFKIFMPEFIVRELDVKNGDWVRAKGVKSMVLKNGTIRTLYEFDIAQRIENEKPTDRVELKFANVEYDSSLNAYYIQASYQESLSMRVMIPEKDVKTFDISEGDLVDYAYWEEELLDGKFIWKHQVDFDIVEPPKIIKQDNRKNGEELEYEETTLLEGMTIVVAGCESMKNTYEEVVNKNSGEFIFVTGDERPEFMERNIRDSDLIITIIDYIGHGGMNKVRDISKKHEIPIVYTRKMGRSSFLKIIKDKLKIETQCAL